MPTDSVAQDIDGVYQPVEKVKFHRPFKKGEMQGNEKIQASQTDPKGAEGVTVAEERGVRASRATLYQTYIRCLDFFPCSEGDAADCLFSTAWYQYTKQGYSGEMKVKSMEALI